RARLWQRAVHGSPTLGLFRAPPARRGAAEGLPAATAGGRAAKRTVEMTFAQPPRNFTHGEILRWRRVGGLVLAEVKYEPGQRVHRHVHAHARFVLVLAGGLSDVPRDREDR